MVDLIKQLIFSPVGWRRIRHYVKKYGFGRFFRKAVGLLRFPQTDQAMEQLWQRQYQQWIQENERPFGQLGPGDWPKMAAVILGEAPTAAESLKQHGYPDLTVCSGDAIPPETDLVLLVDSQVQIAPQALIELARADHLASAELYYADHDHLNDARQRVKPFFKPDWSPDLLRSCNYIGPFFALKAQQFVDLNIETEAQQNGLYGAILKATEAVKHIRHIPKILFHLPDAYEPIGELAALKAHLKRLGRQATVESGMIPHSYRVRYGLPEQPLVSIIMPNKDNPQVITKCVDSLLEKTTYQNFEVIVVDNNSTDPGIPSLYKEWQKHPQIRVKSWPHPFNFSALNNYAVSFAQGKLLLFLNSDTEAMSPGWLEEMVSHLQFEENGVVGAKLYYPSGKIQHAGVTLGLGDVSGHPYKLFDGQMSGWNGRLKLVQDVSAVTGACLLIKRELFDRVGGFDEELAVAFNDIDLCLKVRELGKLVVWTPWAELIHYESITRGPDDNPEKLKTLARETKHFKDRWPEILKQGDPYYSPHLTRENESCALRLKK